MVPVLGGDAGAVAHVAHRSRLPCHVRGGAAARHGSPAARAGLRTAAQAAARGAAALAGFCLPKLHKRKQGSHPVRLGPFPTYLLRCIQGRSGLSPHLSIHVKAPFSCLVTLSVWTNVL